MDDREDGPRNRVVNAHVAGSVVQVDSVGTLNVGVAASPADELDSAVDVVAEATTRMWRSAQATWRIFPEAPVRVGWDRVADRSVRERRQDERLSAGTITRLHDDVYDVPGRRQVVLVGDAGTGKSTAMYLLLHEALARRGPVPVWLTLGRWDPERMTLTQYATSVMAALPVRRRRRLTRKTAERLVDEGRVALFLDGLDEMPPRRRAKAVEAVNRVTDRGVRVVVTTRPARGGSDNVRDFSRPVVIRLKPVDVDAAAEVLLDGRTGADLVHWRELVDFLRANPTSAAARALRTPLTISLARDAFPRADDGAKPVELAAFERQDEVVERLIGLFLERAYSVDAGRDHERRRRREARRSAEERATVTWVAHRLGGERDLAWWHVPTWLPATALGLRCGTRAALAVLCVMLVGAVVPGIGGNWAELLTPVGFAFLAVDVVSRRRIGFPPTALRWRAPRLGAVGRSVLFWLAGGLVVGGIGAVFLGWANGLGIAGLMTVFGVLGGGVALRPDDEVAGGLLASSTVVLSDSSGVTPHGAFRTDVRRTLVAATAGAVFGVLVGAAFGWLFDQVVLTASWGASVCLVGGLAAGTGPGWLLAGARPGRGTRAVMPALERALDRQVLRQAGVVYQFRHAVIQDYLTKR